MGARQWHGPTDTPSLTLTVENGVDEVLMTPYLCESFGEPLGRNGF